MANHILFCRKISYNNPYRICFVCLGNICRSPTAEAIFIHLIKQKQLEKFFIVDSAGMEDYHVGEKSHHTTRAIAKQRGIDITSLARQFTSKDCDYFDKILIMDRSNLSMIRELYHFSPRIDKKVQLIRYYEDKFIEEKHVKDVPDPYFLNRDGFVSVFNILHVCCQNLLKGLIPYIKMP